jgi:hypothetical protein
VRALPGPRTFDRHRHAEISARLGEGSRVVGPTLVEVSREEPARVVAKKGVDSHDTLALQMVEDCLFSDWEESLIGAFAALDTSRRCHVPTRSRRRGRTRAGRPWRWSRVVRIHRPYPGTDSGTTPLFLLTNRELQDLYPPQSNRAGYRP